MKVRYSLSLKLTLIVVLLSTVIIFTLSYINIQDLRNNEIKILGEASEKTVKDFAKSHVFLKDLEEITDSLEKLNNTENLTKSINLLKEKNEEITRININFPNETGIIFVNISTDRGLIGTIPNKYNQNSSEEGHSFYIIGDEKGDENPFLTIISPINISGNLSGTYEIVLSMIPPKMSHDTHIRYIILIGVASIFILIFSLLFLLRRAVVKPIMEFRDKAKLIGKGNLDTQLVIKTNDELGELAEAFNEMSQDLKESRGKIEEYNKILEDLLKQKDEFIGQLGHDLKNPLTPLVGLLPIIMEKEQDPEIKEHLEIIYNNVEYMKDLIFNTLKLAKLRSSNIEFDIEELNLKDETIKVVESQKILLRDNNIELENRIQNDIFIQADKLRISELFINLISNAVKYTKEGGGKITIDALKENGFVKVSVKDSGIGMDLEQQERVFDEFYKADKFSSEAHSSGLGLAICKRIVEKHGGKIWVESLGKDMGSTFYFTLKLVNEK